MTQRASTSPRRLIEIGTLCLVATLLTTTADALDCYPLQVSLAPAAQIIPKEKSICGLRLDLPWGENKSVSGIDLGILNQAESVQGIEIGGVNWLTSEDMSWGVQVGALNFVGNAPFSGIQLGIGNLSNIYGSNLQTANVIQTSLANLATYNVNGIQVAFLVNGAVNVNGLQASIFANGTKKDLNGIQFSYFLNAAKAVNGIQVGILAGNVAENKLNGIQIGVVNGAEEVNGVQIGIINMCEQLKGLQIGVINILTAKHTPDYKSFFKESSFYPIIRIGF